MNTQNVTVIIPARNEEKHIENNKTGIIVPLYIDDYTPYLNNLFKMQPILHENLKSFSYINEINKWKEILK